MHAARHRYGIYILCESKLSRIEKLHTLLRIRPVSKAWLYTYRVEQKSVKNTLEWKIKVLFLYRAYEYLFGIKNVAKTIAKNLYEILKMQLIAATA